MRLRKVRKIIQCACGCGESLEDLDKKARPRKFIKGHFKNRYWLGKSFNNSHREGLRIARARQQEKFGKSPSFKGGISKMNTGYIRVWQPDHPFANRCGYILQHRLVMEEYLGRILLPDEVIHHKNHRRDDNRIENLELFSTQSDHMSIGHKHRK